MCGVIIEYEENLGSPRYVVGKRSIVIACSGNYGYLNLPQHPNSTNCNFLVPHEAGSILTTRTK